MIQSPEHDLAEATDANCVIRILAERSLVQPTDKQEDLLDLITALKKKLKCIFRTTVATRCIFQSSPCDSLSTIDTTSRDQNKLYHCTIALSDGGMIAPWLEAINKSFLKVKI